MTEEAQLGDRRSPLPASPDGAAAPAAGPDNSSSHRTDYAPIQVEDDRTGMTVETLKRALADNLYYVVGRYEQWASLQHYYLALAYTVRDRLLHRWINTTRTYFAQDAKAVFYLSAEFLMGRQLGNNLINVGLYEQARQAVQESGLELHDLVEQEQEPGLGNGGLGRLAACFLDSLATHEIPAVGYGIRYEFGIFDQAIREGWQIEKPDTWLRFGNPWEVPRPDYRVQVRLGGYTQSFVDHEGRYRVRWIPERTVLGTPYDLPVPGYANNTVNTLRLWSARASEEFDFEVFNAGDYTRAVADKIFSENISKVLYPNDNTAQGRELRLEQQYFFVACSLHDIILFYRQNHDTFDAFSDRVAIQLNDTHPAIAIAELMRLLIDDYDLAWEPAWTITRQTFAYTNHTLMPEALEQWPVSLLGRLLPRHLEIIYEINRRFLQEVYRHFPGDDARVRRLSLISNSGDHQVRMAHLACVGSHAVNGVSQVHTDLLTEQVMQDFYQLWPDKFSNKTNGVTPRRWIVLSNPKLAVLITSRLGKSWINQLDRLKQLEPLVDDPQFRQEWRQIKQENKQDLAAYMLHHTGIEVDVQSMFDVQVKRIHEYKRQLLKVLHIITLYNRIKQNPALEILPRTVILSGKAAPGYWMAKLIIKLINAVAEVVNHDADVGDRLKVLFLANYSVSLAERICPAADLSEQISLAGTEASGTGNMKFAMNGALTIGTLDGANIEIREAVGPENFFLFGLTTHEVARLKARGYNPWDYYNTNAELRQVIDRINSGYFSPGDPDLFRPIIQSLLLRDEYLVLADYQAYIHTQSLVAQTYRDQETWARMAMLNVARMGPFSSDRAVQDYCRDTWRVQPVPIALEDYQPQDAVLKVKQRLNHQVGHSRQSLGHEPPAPS